jgi:hypothetical protein
MEHHPHRHQQGGTQTAFQMQASSKRRQLLVKLPLEARDHICSNSNSNTGSKRLG